MFAGSGAGNIGLSWALRAGWVQFWFQPKIDLASRRICGAEMFARVEHPFHGTLAARLFLAGAGRDSLMRLAAQGITAALQAGDRLALMGARFPIAVNAPPEIDDCLHLAESILGERSVLALAHRNLILDVSEQSIIDDPDQFAALTARLTDLGIGLAVDDFGKQLGALLKSDNGAAADDELARVARRMLDFRRIALCEFKIDRALVLGCSRSPRQADTCRLLIDLIHTFGCKAIAVGVESIADARCLMALGCDVGQGHLFSAPVPMADFVALLKRRAVA